VGSKHGQLPFGVEAPANLPRGRGLFAIPKDHYGDTGRSIEEAARLIRSAPSKTNAPESLTVLPSRLNFIYVYVGAPERIMEYPERALEVGLASGVRFLFELLLAPVRKTERFKAFVRKSGILAYWRERGWPEFCHPTAADDFECN
jgi:hypothetical protein